MKKDKGTKGQRDKGTVSVPANISEGAARNQTKEYIRFLRISQGSLSELETLFIICTNLGFLDETKSINTQGKMAKIRAQLTGQIKALSRKLT